MLPNAFASQRYLRFLRGLADRRAGREEAGPWEQGCWQAGDLRSMGGQDRGCEQHGPPPCWEKIPAKVSDSGKPVLHIRTERRMSMCRTVKLGAPLHQLSDPQERRPHICQRHSPPVACGPRSRWGGSWGRSWCRLRGVLPTQMGSRATCSPGFLGRVLPAEVPGWGRLREEGAKEQEVRGRRGSRRTVWRAGNLGVASEPPVSRAEATQFIPILPQGQYCFSLPKSSFFLSSYSIILFLFGEVLVCPTDGVSKSTRARIPHSPASCIP